MNGLLSVVIPSYNEQGMIARTAATVAQLLSEAQIPYELVFVDDGSSDATWECICTAHTQNERVRGVSFSRNFGKDPAIFAGLANAHGDCVAVIDCDLQHPPEKLIEMYRLWQQGYEVVEAVKCDRGRESRLHAWCAGCFYSLITRAVGSDMRRASDFKLLDRRAVDVLLAIPEQEAFFRALSSWVGFRRTQVEFAVAPREEGQSKWSLKSLVRYALSGIAAFSGAPLQFSAVFGVLCLLGALLGTVGSLCCEEVWTLFFAAGTLLAFAGLFLCLSIVGYYLFRIYTQSLNRPRYIISRTIGGQE